MRAVTTFETMVVDGKIEIPAWYRDAVAPRVTVVVVNQVPIEKKQPVHENMDDVFGCMHDKANPALWPLESQGWAIHVREKYGCDLSGHQPGLCGCPPLCLPSGNKSPHKNLR